MEYSVTQVSQRVRLPPNSSTLDADKSATNAWEFGKERPTNKWTDVLGPLKVAKILH